MFADWRAKNISQKKFSRTKDSVTINTVTVTENGSETGTETGTESGDRDRD